MTVHSSKGLEFPYVFVVGMEENIFPSGGWLASESDIEEERRLFYVAMTRAKKTVAFSFTQTRMRNGKHETNSPSRFLYEIDSSYVANPLVKEREGGEVRRQSFSMWKKDGGSSRLSGNTYGSHPGRRWSVDHLSHCKESPTLLRLRCAGLRSSRSECRMRISSLRLSCSCVQGRGLNITVSVLERLSKSPEIRQI